MAAVRNLLFLLVVLCSVNWGLAKQRHSHPRPSASASKPSSPTQQPVIVEHPVVNDELGDVVQQAETTIVSFFNDTKTKFEQALANLSSYLPINVDYTLNVSHLCDPVQYNREYYHTIALILSAVLVALGAVFAFIGYRLMKLVLFLIGFLSAGAITYFVILAFTHNISASWVLYVSIIVPIVVGVIAGLLVICLYYIGIFLAGSSIGFLIVWFILAGIDIEFFRTHIYVPILIAVGAGIVMGVVTLFVQKWFFMFGTTVLGSFMIVWGLDYYLELGSIVYYLVLFAEHRAHIKLCWYSWVMVALFGILILVGFLVQAFLTGRKYDHKKALNAVLGKDSTVARQQMPTAALSHQLSSVSTFNCAALDMAAGICCGLCNKKKKSKKTDGAGKYMTLKEMND